MKTEFWYPPGFPRAEERFLQRCALALVSLAGFIIFLCQFSATLRGLQTALRTGAEGLTMPPLPALTAGCWIGFLVLALGQVVLAAARYLWGCQGGGGGGRRRALPRRGGLARRCLAAPAAALGWCVLAAVAVAVLCALYYRVFTPAGLLPAHWLLGGAVC